MSYDVAFRHHQALDPSALLSVGATLHALERAIEDCRKAGKSAEIDPAVLLLARHLGTVATADGLSGMTLRRACLDAIAAIRERPALVALAGRGVANDPAGKATFHAGARRALRQLAQALGLEAGSYQVRSNMGAAVSSGEITLEAPELWVEVALWPMCSGREVAFRSRRGRNRWAAINELIAPERFAARLRRELGLGPARESAALSAEQRGLRIDEHQHAA